MRLNLIPVVITLLLIIACSGGSAPVTQPDLTPDINFREATGYSRTVFGMWTIDVSADHSEVEVLPVRNVEGHFNIRTFLEDGPCTDCLTVTGITPEGNGVLDIDVQIRHPFPGLDQFTGFDVRGTVMFSSTSEFPSSGLNWSNMDKGGGGLLNPDGWTTLFNPLDFTEAAKIFNYQQGKIATELFYPVRLNPFKAFYIDPNRRPFLSTDVITETYRLKLPAIGVRFGYVVDASWEKPTPSPPVNIPEDFPITANSIEAYRITATVGEGLDEHGGEANCAIDIYDWQGTATISNVLIESPDLFDGFREAEMDQDFGTISKWSVPVNNLKEAPKGNYPLLLTVNDKYEDANAGALASYFVIYAHVAEGPPWDPGVYVDRDYPGLDEGLPEDGTPDHPFNTINEGINDSEYNEKIFIDPSDEPYTEQVYLQDGTWLVGLNWRNDGDSGQPVCEATDYPISIYGVAISDLIIDNLEIRPGLNWEFDEFLYGIQLDYSDPGTHQSNATVRNCTFTGDRRHTGDNVGDEITGCEVSLTDNFVFENNVITDMHAGSDQGGYLGGLHVDVCDGVTVRNNVIKNCTSKNSFLGMHIWYSDLPVLVEGNTLEYLANSDQPTGFTIGWGINVIGYSDVTVRHNTVHDIGLPGHRLETVPLFFRAVGIGQYYNWNIENNLIYNIHAQDAENTTNSADCRGIMFRINSDNSLDGLKIRNNTIVGLESGEYVTGIHFDVGSGNIITNYEISNNIIMDVKGPAVPDSFYDSGLIYIETYEDPLFIDYNLFNNIDIPNPLYLNVDEGDHIIMDQDPLFTLDYHIPLESPGQLGDPSFLDFDDAGPASNDPDNTDPETRSRMGAFGGEGGDW